MQLQIKQRNINYPLVFGGIIVVFLLFISIFGHSLAPLDPFSLNFAKSFYQNGEWITIEQQIPPNNYNVLGTDILGRDIFSFIIYGARLTLSTGLLFVAIRFLVALPMALFAGFNGKVSSKIIDFFSRVFSTIPALVFCILILSFSKVRQLQLGSSILIFTLVLTFVGWGRLAKVLKNRIEDILNEDFIQGEIAIGKSNFLIAIQNVLPHLTATIIINIFFEMGRILILIAELGIFEAYIGGFKFSRELISELQLDFMPNYYPEWGGLLGSSRYAITADKTWIALFPALAFFISILGFNLLGEGLKIEVNKRTSKVITVIRRIPYYLSPRTIIYELRNIRNNRRPVAIKVIILLVVIIIPLIPAPESLYKVNADSIFSYVHEFEKDKYEGRMTGTNGRDEAADYICDELKSYGIKPFFKEEYVKEYRCKAPIAQIQDSRMYIQSSNGDVLADFDIRRDYYLSNTINGRYIDGIVNFALLSSGNILTLEQYNNQEYDENKKYYIVFDKPVNFYSPLFFNSDYIRTASKTKLNESIVGYIISRQDDYKNEDFEERERILIAKEVKNFNINTYHDSFKSRETPPTICVNEETLKTIVNYAGKKLTLENNINAILGFNAKNIGGIIEGKDTSNENTVYITTNYDYFGYEGDMKYKGLLYNSTSVAATFEMAKILSSIDEKPEKTIVFLFFDASKYLRDTGSKLYMKNDFSKVTDIFAISMNDLGAVDSDTLYIDTSYADTIQKKYYEYIKYIKKRADQLRINLKQSKIVDCYDDIAYLKNGRGKGILLKSIKGDSDLGMKYNGTQQNDISIIDKNKLSKQVQLILDTIVYVVYGDK